MIGRVKFIDTSLIAHIVERPSVCARLPLGETQREKAADSFVASLQFGIDPFE